MFINVFRKSPQKQFIGELTDLQSFLTEVPALTPMVQHWGRPANCTPIPLNRSTTKSFQLADEPPTEYLLWWSFLPVNTQTSGPFTVIESLHYFIFLSWFFFFFFWCQSFIPTRKKKKRSHTAGCFQTFKIKVPTIGEKKKTRLRPSRMHFLLPYTGFVILLKCIWFSSQSTNRNAKTSYRKKTTCNISLKE